MEEWSSGWREEIKDVFDKRFFPPRVAVEAIFQGLLKTADGEIN